MKKHFLILLAMVLSFQVNAIRPEREYPRTPALFEIPYEEYKVKTPDHLDLNVWEYSIKNTVSTRTVILVGTDAGNMSYFIWQAKALRELGMRVVAFDYRGFGKSSDYNLKAENLFHVEFATDLDSVIKATLPGIPMSPLDCWRCRWDPMSACCARSQSTSTLQRASTTILLPFAIGSVTSRAKRLRFLPKRGQFRL